MKKIINLYKNYQFEKNGLMAKSFFNSYYKNK